MLPTNCPPRTGIRLPAPCPLHEPRSSRREEAHYYKTEIRNLKSEIDESLLTSAATVQGFNAQNFSRKSLPEPPPRPLRRPRLLVLGTSTRTIGFMVPMHAK